MAVFRIELPLALVLYLMVLTPGESELTQLPCHCPDLAAKADPLNSLFVLFVNQMGKAHSVLAAACSAIVELKGTGLDPGTPECNLSLAKLCPKKTEVSELDLQMLQVDRAGVALTVPHVASCSESFVNWRKYVKTRCGGSQSQSLWLVFQLLVYLQFQLVRWRIPCRKRHLPVGLGVL